MEMGKVDEVMSNKPGFIKNVVGMFKDRGTPLRNKVLMIGGVIYFVSPIDLIPDFVALLGYTDDLGVLIGTGTLFYKSYKTYVEKLPPSR
jgi:uncharacterized membrane protein YkvA (DUF1232 family)